MAPEVTAQIFDPFFTTKARGEGTGLGLSMVFGFIKQSGGHINVYSEPGVGTTFRLYLPRDRHAGEPEEPKMAESKAAGGGETILVVEDNAALRRAVVLQLTTLGYHVRESENAAAAVANLESGEPVDLLFADVVMPGKLDGYDLARIVRERWPSIRIVLTSGFPGGNPDRASRGVADIPLLTKPYRRDALAQTLHEALKGRPDGPSNPTGAVTR
jgi:CheY-like chemotaxis protein